MINKEIGVIEHVSDPLTGEGNLRLFVLDNDLFASHRNRSCPILREPAFLSPALEFLQKQKRTKLNKQLIDFYTEYKEVPANPQLQAELKQLEQEAREKDEVELILFAAESARIPHVVFHRIIVPSEKRHQGIGTFYIQKVMQICDRYAHPLVLDPSNAFGSSVTKLRKFYKKLGFKNNNQIGLPLELVYKGEKTE